MIILAWNCRGLVTPQLEEIWEILLSLIDLVLFFFLRLCVLMMIKLVLLLIDMVLLFIPLSQRKVFLGTSYLLGKITQKLLLLLPTTTSLIAWSNATPLILASSSLSSTLLLLRLQELVSRTVLKILEKPTKALGLSSMTLTPSCVVPRREAVDHLHHQVMEASRTSWITMPY